MQRRVRVSRKTSRVVRVRLFYFSTSIVQDDGASGDVPVVLDENDTNARDNHADTAAVEEADSAEREEAKSSSPQNYRASNTRSTTRSPSSRWTTRGSVRRLVTLRLPLSVRRIKHLARALRREGTINSLGGRAPEEPAARPQRMSFCNFHCRQSPQALAVAVSDNLPFALDSLLSVAVDFHCAMEGALSVVSRIRLSLKPGLQHKSKPKCTRCVLLRPTRLYLSHTYTTTGLRAARASLSWTTFLA
jgi:hypothetical protein